jgi:hypothetical protein
LPGRTCFVFHNRVVSQHAHFFGHLSRHHIHRAACGIAHQDLQGFGLCIHPIWGHGQQAGGGNETEGVTTMGHGVASVE